MELIGGVVFAIVLAGVLGYALLKKKKKFIPSTREEILKHYGVEVDPEDYHINTDPGDDNRFI